MFHPLTEEGLSCFGQNRPGTGARNLSKPLPGKGFRIKKGSGGHGQPGEEGPPRRIGFPPCCGR